MSFGATTRRNGDISVIDIKGRLTLIEGEAIHDLLVDLLREGRKRVVLNFRDVSYLDSSGLGQIIRTLFTAKKHGAELYAVELHSRAREILRLTNLHTVFTDFPDEQTAMRNFSS